MMNYYNMIGTHPNQATANLYSMQMGIPNSNQLPSSANNLANNLTNNLSRNLYHTSSVLTSQSLTPSQLQSSNSTKSRGVQSTKSKKAGGGKSKGSGAKKAKGKGKKKQTKKVTTKGKKAVSTKDLPLTSLNKEQIKELSKRAKKATPYNVFVKENYNSVREEFEKNPDVLNEKFAQHDLRIAQDGAKLSKREKAGKTRKDSTGVKLLSVVTHELSERWKGMSNEDKKVYQDKANEENEYSIEMHSRMLARIKINVLRAQKQKLEAHKVDAASGKKGSHRSKTATPYNIFMKENYQSIREEVERALGIPEGGSIDADKKEEHNKVFSAVTREVSARWKTLNPLEKQEYEKKAEIANKNTVYQLSNKEKEQIMKKASKTKLTTAYNLYIKDHYQEVRTELEQNLTLESRVNGWTSSHPTKREKEGKMKKESEGTKLFSVVTSELSNRWKNCDEITKQQYQERAKLENIKNAELESTFLKKLKKSSALQGLLDTTIGEEGEFNFEENDDFNMSQEDNGVETDGISYHENVGVAMNHSPTKLHY